MDGFAELLKASDVARMLRLGRTTVYDLAARGDLPCIVISAGRRRPIIRFAPEAVDRWLRERSRPEGSPA